MYIPIPKATTAKIGPPNFLIVSSILGGRAATLRAMNKAPSMTLSQLLTESSE